MPLGAADDLVGGHVADDDERGVVGAVEAAVVAVEIVAGHRLDVRQPADRRVVVRVGLERGRGQLDVEQLLGIVLAAFDLGDDHRALGLALGGLVQAVSHPLGLDEEHAIERVAGGGLEVGRLVDPGIAVPGAAERLDEPLHPVARDVGRALEVHVLDEVRGSRETRPLVLRAHAVPAPHRGDGRRAQLAHEDGEPVVEGGAPERRRPGRCLGHTAIIPAGVHGAGSRA